ncbi:hypothetical protein [Ileibacterium valens]|uniref:hypothetical protein n=1 Tax=Ileibacterium valens TaxID=1862668 RepID=UPI00272AD410|nr:hypothetical protein [Ileibacterium valens]
MNTTVIEIRKNEGTLTALLMKNEPAKEKYIIARSYDPIQKQWYGGGTYFTDLFEAVKEFEKRTRG